MFRLVFGAFIVLHGLVHLWFVVLAQGIVEVREEMGWTGRSWALSAFLGDSTVRLLATVLYAVCAIAFIVAGAAILLQLEWWQPATLGAALLSGIVITAFWAGGRQNLVAKGIIGLLIDLVIIAVVILVANSSILGIDP